MRILIDTNIFIYREESHETPLNVQTLFRILGELSISVYVHSLSVDEIKRNKDEKRRAVVLSKINSYPQYKDYMNPEKDADFISAVGAPNNTHDEIDNYLLHSIYKNAFDFLITEDRNIHRKSKAIGIPDRVFDIDEAVEYLINLRLDENLPLPVEINRVPIANLNYEEPILDSLKNGYSGFKDWWDKISREGRNAWVYQKGAALGAILILKVENESIDSSPALPKVKRLKICTFKVSETGKKIGELFVKISVEYAVKNGIDEIYLTHFTEENDFLVPLIEEFGFYKAAEKKGEEIFCKKLMPEDVSGGPLDISLKYYPSFYDGNMVKKFIIPIRPQYYRKLFIDYSPKQLDLEGIANGIATEGNTIKKAYLCHSRITRINEGDVVLFYRSEDLKSIMAIGIVEKAYENSTNTEQIIRSVGKRSVYTHKEIGDMAAKPTKVIIFRHHFLLAPVSFETLKEQGILLGAPQSIQEISHESYLKIKKIGGIDERFTVH